MPIPPEKLKVGESYWMDWEYGTEALLVKVVRNDSKGISYECDDGTIEYCPSKLMAREFRFYDHEPDYEERYGAFGATV